MSRKRILSMILAIVLCVSMAACGNQTTATQKPTETKKGGTLESKDTNDKKDPSKPAETAATEAPTEPAPTEPPYHIEKGSITGFETTFSEGRAWVDFETTNRRKGTALIDENGYVYCVSNDANAYCYYPVLGGYTAVYRLDGITIYDANGTCTFSHTNTPEDKMGLYCCGEGIFIIREEIAGFSESAIYWYAMDAYGNLLYQKRKGDISLNTYLGEGIFIEYSSKTHNCTSIYNSATDVFIEPVTVTSNQKGFYINNLAPFCDGVAIALLNRYGMPSSNATETIAPENLASNEAYIEWLDKIDAQGHWLGAFDWNPDLYSEGCLVNRKNVWPIVKTIRGELGIFKYPKYPDSVKVESVGTMSGGYIPLALEGADGYCYVTMMYVQDENDENMKELYSPVCLGKATKAASVILWKKSGTTAVTNSWYTNGHFYYNTRQFMGKEGLAHIDPSGQITDITYLTGGSNSYLWTWKVEGDRLYFSNFMTDLDGNILLDSISIRVND